MIIGIWVLAGLAAGLVAVELASGDGHKAVTWFRSLLLGLIGSFVGGFLGYRLEPAGSATPVISIMFSLIGACAVVGCASVIQYHAERNGMLKS